jgi:ribosomal protein L32
MNREERRRYHKKIKNRKEASICPYCNNLSLFLATSRGENDTVVKCEICGEIIFEGSEVTRIIPPGIYLPLPISMFKTILEEEKKKSSLEEISPKEGISSND